MHGITAPLPPQYSQELRDTLARMLATDPAKRITLEQLLALHHVASRLHALQAAGAVRAGAIGGRVPAEVLDGALRRLEASGRPADIGRVLLYKSAAGWGWEMSHGVGRGPLSC